MELLGLNTAELIECCASLGEPPFRGRQIAEWLYKKGAHDIAEMTDLPATLRAKLTKEARVGRSQVVKESKSVEGSRKFLIKLIDGETIESVLLPYPDRTSVCVSSQIGCAAGCVFCATADCGFVRDLSAGEIVDQVLTLREQGGTRVSHVVFMGMGEPLLNLENVLKAMRLLNEEVGIAMRRMTISTVGITPAIDRLSSLDLQLTLAVSLHAADDALRRTLIPVSRKYPLSELVEVCREYANKTKRRITFEYLLLAGVNDSPEQASALAKLLRGMMCHVNLIPYNEVAGKPYERPSRRSITAFRAALETAGIEVTQRLERGHSVAAACGQLRKGF